MWVAAAAGAVVSPILLIMDLGRPHLFLNMLRVFKHRSAMSMGAWILSFFGRSRYERTITLQQVLARRALEAAALQSPIRDRSSHGIHAP